MNKKIVKEYCPITYYEPCIGEYCDGFCSLLKKAILKGFGGTITQCRECGMYLIPYNGIWLHPNNDNCKYFNMLQISVKIMHDEYEKELGNPDYTYQDLIKYVTSRPKNIFIRGWFWLRDRLRV